MSENKQWTQDYIVSLSFKLDDFQLQALDIIGDEQNLLVGAPTGAGKTVVGDAGIFYWSRTSRMAKVFYTTPIKALSNQKFHELQRKYGNDNVGLITGDTVINASANIVVMTTEVLRNQVYANSSALDDLKCVVMDEVHFLGDRTRGSVWEEVLIHLPLHVQILALSATVSNIEEFAAWLNKIRGNCQMVITDHRPIPLIPHVILSDDEVRNGAKLYDIYEENGALNAKLRSKMSRPMRMGPNRTPKGRRGKGRSFPNAHKVKGLRKIPRREAIIQQLQMQDMLPAIYFIFSRAGCDEAVSHILHSNLSLTSVDEAKEIAFAADLVAYERLTQENLELLGYTKFKQALKKGVAAHHAGLVPLYKEIIEHLFERGLIKVVFATETLALGINMPAKSVVIERLTKFDGVGHSRLTPGQFTQLTGRAGRRGLDKIGHAIVVDGKNLTLDDVASLVSNRMYPLKSAFTPGYNMAVNLASKFNDVQAAEILLKSYAQFQTEQKLRVLKDRLNEYNEALIGYEAHFDDENPNASTRWRNRYNKVVARKARTQKEIATDSMKISNKYFRILSILLKFDYLERVDGQYLATKAGQILENIYCEYELLLAQMLYSGMLNDFSEAELASFLSCFVSLNHKVHSNTFRPEFVPGNKHSKLREALIKLNAFEKEVTIAEKQAGVFQEEDDGLNYAMLDIAYFWGQGAELDEILYHLSDADLGDFIRLAKGVLDILQQLVRYAGDFCPKNTVSLLSKLENGVVAMFLE